MTKSLEQVTTQRSAPALPVPVLVGATASGKTSLAVQLARRLSSAGRPAEIVNADSMLIYRGMDIGTAKPTATERDGVPHHLIDILDVTQTASVAEFQALARQTIDACRHRGVIPVVVGGSALYVRAVVDEFEFPGTDPTVRARLENELADYGPELLHRRLTERDPEAAAAILARNGRRIVRALEVIELTGRRFSARLPDHSYALEGVVQIGLEVPRPVLDQRIADRVRQMWADGFVDEVKALERIGLRDGLTACRGLGYRQILDFLDGEITEAEAVDRTITATRKFARRQDGWFRKDRRVSWVAPEAPDVVDRILALL